MPASCLTPLHAVHPSAVPAVRVSRKGADRLRNGQPWVYASDVEMAPSSLEGGEVVRVGDPRDAPLGLSFFSKASQIRLRWLAFVDVPVDRDFFARRVRQADELRQRLLPGQTTYRVVHGEADLLPGLVVDRYGDWLSVQLLIPAMERRKALITEVLSEHFRPRGIVNRSDASVRRLEGLEPEKGLLAGEAPPPHFSYHEGSVELAVDLLEGQKTGAFLDQRDNHLRAGELAKGEALDCFSYTGGFALQLARRAERVTAVEISESACALLRANAQRNGLANVDVVTANAFDFLRDALSEGRRFDTIVLDPPSFAKSKSSVDAAVRGYKEINLRALQLLRPGGLLMTASCTHHVDEARFEALLDEAAADARRRVQILERRSAGVDHPVLLGLRETRYLKCFVLRVVE